MNEEGLTPLVQLLHEVKTFTTLLNEKGYTGYFQTSAGYSDKLQNSLEAYLYESMLGNEPGLKNGISLRTFLTYHGENKEYIECAFRVNYNCHRLEIERLIVELKQNSTVLKKVNIGWVLRSNLPTSKELIDKVYQQAPAVKKRQGIKH